MSTTGTAGSEETTEDKRQAILRITVIVAGLVGGLLLGALAEFDEHLTVPWEVGLGELIFMFTMAFILMATPERMRWVALLSAIIALLLATVSFKVARFDGESSATIGHFWDWFWYWVSAPVIAYVLIVRSLTAIEERSPRLPYSRVFNHLFAIPVQLLFALAVVGLLNLLIWLWSELFEVIGIDLIGKLWNEPLIWGPMSGAFVGLGVALARQWTNMTSALRTLCRFVARFALPIFAFFTVTLLIALPIQGLGDLFGSRSAAKVMSALAAFSIFLIYGARQDRDEAPPAWLRISTALVILGLPVYTALAVWAVWIRVGQYGFTPDRYVGLVLALILFLHAAGLLAVQALDLIRRKGWLTGAGPVNMMALFLLTVFFLAVHAPPLDPFRISAENQFSRLADQRVDAAKFDYGYLRFRLGPAGQKALDRLKSLDSHPQFELIRSRVEIVENTEGYWQWQAKRDELEEAPPPEE